MSVKLKLQPFSASSSQTKLISFVLSGFNINKKYRISFENATFSRDVKIISCKNFDVLNNKIFCSNVENVSGEIDLVLYQSDSVSVVSIYANIEEYSEFEKWQLVDIAAFSFQIENPLKKTTSDKIFVYPPFVGLEEKATIKVQTDPNSNIHIIINNKTFVVKSNFSGEGTFSFRSADILSGSSKTLYKLPVSYSKVSDNYTEIYDSGVFVHFVPENMKALQATNDPSAPECAIIDPSPGQGLTIKKLDDYCIDGPVVGPLSIFDTENSKFFNSKVGFCSDPVQVYPTVSNDAVCRIFNSTSSVILSNGSGLAVFSSQETFISDPYVFPTLSSRVFIADIPSSLKYKGNPVRDGTIIAPPKFYHTVTPNAIAVDEKYSVTFRVEDGTVFEIQYTSLLGTSEEVVSSFVDLINNDIRTRQYDIKAINQITYFELKSDNRFTIRSDTILGNGVLAVSLRSNRTLDLITDEKGISDSGDTVVFLVPKVGYQSHTIVSRDLANKLIRIDVPSGFNNDVGPNINENIYCEKFVVIDSQTILPEIDLVKVNPLPYVYDIFSREVPCIYPVIATRKVESTGEEIVYVVCQAPVDGVYQLFFYSFRVGENIENLQWKQLTKLGENKNAKIKCDEGGNLHLIWESDRMGPTQIYYSVLGISSRPITNSTLMSIINKNVEQNNEVDLFSISSSKIAIQDNWTRILQNNGRASVSNPYSFVISGIPSEDAAMAFFSLTNDEFGDPLSWNFGQLSYQLSFNFSAKTDITRYLNSKDIDKLFDEWKSEFKPVGSYKYEKDGNIYTIDSYSTFYENIIPICGSYKLNTDTMKIVSGGATHPDLQHNYSLVYADFKEEIKLSQPSSIKHFMLAMMPEKIRFKAKNTESYTQYCERLGFSSFDCVGFNNEIEYEIKTGKYKLALFISTSENDNSGEISKKTYKISRFLSGYIDSISSAQIDIAVHYSKMSSDYITYISNRENEPFGNDHRYNGDIIVSVNGKAVFAKNFIADFTDQYRKFDIGLGLPPGQGIVIDESIPYKGNMYDQENISQSFSNINIGPHSLVFNKNYIDFSSFDRDTSQMVITENVKNIIPNGGFETNVLPFSNETLLLDGYQGITGWTIGYGSIYRRTAGGA